LELRVERLAWRSARSSWPVEEEAEGAGRLPLDTCDFRSEPCLGLLDLEREETEERDLGCTLLPLGEVRELEGFFLRPRLLLFNEDFFAIAVLLTNSRIVVS